MNRVALVRHPTPDIAPGLCYGRTDLALAPGAGPSIAAIVAALSDVPARRLWTSPAARCTQVAQAIGDAMKVAPVADARLLEMDFGDWEGVAWDDVPRAMLDRWAAAPMEFAPPGGESGAALVARVRAFHDLVAAHGEDAVIVAHGGPLKVLAALLGGRPIDLLAPAPAIGSVEILTVALSAQDRPPSP